MSKYIKIAELYERDGGICGICRKPCLIEDASRDHIKARAKGGSDSRANLQLAHKRCNTMKGDGETRLLVLPKVAKAPPAVPPKPPKGCPYCRAPATRLRSVRIGLGRGRQCWNCGAGWAVYEPSTMPEALVAGRQQGI